MYRAPFQDCVSKNSDLTQGPALLGAHVSEEETVVYDVLADWIYRTELQEFFLNLVDPLQSRVSREQSDYLTQNRASSASRVRTFREQEMSDGADVPCECVVFQWVQYS